MPSRQEGVSLETLVDARHKIIGYAARPSGRWPAGQERMALDPQTSAACPRTSPCVQFPLEIRILYLGGFRWTNPNGGQNGGQTHSPTKRRSLIKCRL